MSSNSSSDATLAIFDFQGAEIRTITQGGEPLFCAKDIATILGYADATNAVKQHCKGVAFHHPLATAGGEQEARFIREADLYRLVMGSRLPQAIEFEKHVMEVILPCIRKTGHFEMPRDLAQALRTLAALEEELALLREIVDEQAPAVNFVQNYVRADGLFGVRQTAKILGVTQNAFVDLCLDRGVLFRENGSLQPYAPWIKAGYFHVRTGEQNDHAYVHTRFTSKGVAWARSKLKIGPLLATPAPIEA